MLYFFIDSQSLSVCPSVFNISFRRPSFQNCFHSFGPPDRGGHHLTGEGITWQGRAWRTARSCWTSWSSEERRSRLWTQGTCRRRSYRLHYKATVIFWESSNLSLHLRFKWLLTLSHSDQLTELFGPWLSDTQSWFRGKWLCVQSLLLSLQHWQYLPGLLLLIQFWRQK